MAIGQEERLHHRNMKKEDASSVEARIIQLSIALTMIVMMMRRKTRKKRRRTRKARR